MAKKATKKRSPAKARSRRATSAMPKEAKVAYGELQRGLERLEKSAEQIQRSIWKTEWRIQADARRRVQQLRKDAAAQLRILETKRRDVARLVSKLSRAAGGSWKDIKRSAESILKDARATAASVADRFRDALGS